MLSFATINGVDCQGITAETRITDLLALVTFYNPELGGINCDEDCSTFADLTAVDDEDYGHYAACPAELFGRSIELLGEIRYCGDTGGDIRVKYSSYYQAWVVQVDLLEKDHFWCNYCLVEWEVVR